MRTFLAATIAAAASAELMNAGDYAFMKFVAEHGK